MVDIEAGADQMRREQAGANKIVRKRKLTLSDRLLYAMILVIGILAGQSMGAPIQGTSMETVQETTLSGTVTMAGSTSMETFVNALAEGFMNRYPQVIVTAEFTGSSAGIEAVLAGSVDIGNSSRRLRPEEKAAGAVEHVVALDGIVVVTDADNFVRELTKEQLGEIYQGNIRNWRQVGGTDTAIVVVGREAGSGTRETFEAFLGLEDTCAYANELHSTGAVMARVSSTPGAIGYVSFEVLDDTVSVVAIDGVMPTEEAIREGLYRLSRPYVMVTKGELEKQCETVREFFLYLDAEEGRSLLRRAGGILPDE